MLQGSLQLSDGLSLRHFVAVLCALSLPVAVILSADRKLRRH